jgi:hypothetical protein
MFVGGTASQYDLCAKKGFVPAVKPSAEDTARAMLEKLQVSSGGVDQSLYIGLTPRLTPLTNERQVGAYPPSRRPARG